MKRGELWTVSGGGYAGKPRPTLIIQDETWESSSITTIPLTSHVIDAPLWRVTIPATEESGLMVDSQVMVDKITTVKVQNLDRKIGQISTAQMREVERLLLSFLGIAR